MTYEPEPLPDEAHAWAGSTDEPASFEGGLLVDTYGWLPLVLDVIRTLALIVIAVAVCVR